MKLLSSQQIREADRETISRQSITSIELMERAAAACVQYIITHIAQTSFHILCGRGNNGGDGLAIARLLAEASYTVSVQIIAHTEHSSADFDASLSRLSGLAGIGLRHISHIDELELPDSTDTMLIDALLGTGVSRPIEGLLAQVIDQVNAASLPIIAIDMPSGLPVDTPMESLWPVVRASITLSFQQPKLLFLLPETGDYVGRLVLLDIGLDTAYIDTLPSPYYFTTYRDLRPLLLHRSRFSHKGTFGHSLLIAGSHGRMGAALLAAHACLCSGTGLLTTHIPACGYAILQTALPESMLTIDPDEHHITTIGTLDAYSAIGIGPGIGTAPDTAAAVRRLIQTGAGRLVIDADALNILSENKTWLAFLPPHTILSPHPKEFDRLTQVHRSSYDRLETARALAARHHLIIVLKGAYTAVVLPDRSVRFNTTGNPSLAKGGSGDVLTGILTALLARGYPPAQAASIGVYLHGLAADLAIAHIHPESMLASDLIAHLSDAFSHLYADPHSTEIGAC